MSEDRSSSLSLNEDFQKFLEASLSSDESELDLSENKKRLWWLDGEDDGNVKQKESANRHSWLKKVETKKTDEDQKDSDSQTIKEIIESKSAVQETTSQDKEVENLSSKQESEAGKENVFTFDSKSHVSEKPEILTSDDQTLVQSLPDDDYSEDTFNTLTSKDEIAEEESNISSHITSETTKNPNENSTNNSEKVEIISSPVLPRLKEQENKAEKTEIKSTVDLLPEADDLIDKKNDHMNHVDSGKHLIPFLNLLI
ncbi:uncharacterized protein LOC111617822 [Centruroides sculpturatus]|uniref:uncharacterized protein LOC111617822 n=1 Tax=Centruroides sculpturatus TaxID=218467 RepID=UPI000C6D1072|nr:uncharacterized protein LOC111617822 [Centruroides sculpturatus]